MRKRMKIGNSFLVKSAAFIIICSMTAGSIAIPVFAEEEKLGLQKIGDSGRFEEEKDSQQRIKEEEQNPGVDTDEENLNSDEEEAVSDADADGENLDRDEGKTAPDADADGESLDRDEEETVSDADTDGESLNSSGEDTDAGNDTGEEKSKHTGEDTVSGNTIEKEEEFDSEQVAMEVIDVVVPSTYILALNPYCLPIRTGETKITTEQVISGMYGIVNKSSSDQIVTVSLTVEDGNGGELVFVDSVEEAEEAGENVYAVYLSVVPADEGQILIDGEPVNKNVSGESLQNVEMTGAQERAVPLHSGSNQIAFKLPGAVYGSEREDEDTKSEPVEYDLGVTAYTFSGVMNPNAAWEKLSDGIRLSVMYTYQTADGSEEIVDGTGAMISMD